MYTRYVRHNMNKASNVQVENTHLKILKFLPEVLSLLHQFVDLLVVRVEAPHSVQLTLMGTQQVIIVIFW